MEFAKLRANQIKNLFSIHPEVETASGIAIRIWMISLLSIFTAAKNEKTRNPTQTKRLFFI